jgi:hypothetical protein
MQKLTLIALVWCASQAANASEWRILLGGINAYSDSNVKVNSLNVQEEEFVLDFERDLELKDRTILPEAKIQYQFADRHSVSFSFFRLNRSGTNQNISQPFEVNWADDNTYQVQVGAALTTDFNYEIYRLFYSYELYQSDRFNLGTSLGLHIIPVELSLAGEIQACANDGVQQICDSEETRVVSEDITAPLPNIGFYGSWYFAPRWTLSADTQFFYIELDTFKGSLLEVNTFVSYQFNEHWQGRLGYGLYDVRAVNDGDRADLEVNVLYQGGKAAVEYAF